MSEGVEQLGFFDDALNAPRPHEYRVPRGAGIAHCRSCGAQVIWIQTKTGANVPLALASVVTRDNAQWAQSHFLDCPQARAWGKKSEPAHE